MGIDLMSVDRSSLQALGGKPRPANDSEVSAYMRWQRERRGLPDMQGMELEWSIYPGSRGQRLCIGATFGKLLASGGHNRDENGNYTYTAPQYENGAYSLVMPGHNAHKQTVTFESLDDAGNVERAQTLPMEPKKGGVIWSRDDVRKAHGPVEKVRKPRASKAPIPVEATPIPVRAEAVAVDPVEICQMEAAGSDSGPCAVAEAPEAPEALCEAVSGQDEPSREAEQLPADPVADLAERVAALEARLEALAVETGPVAENTNNSSPEFIAAPSGEVARPARTAAHERAIRRAWAERKARRGAQGGMAIHMRRIEALEMELRLAQHEQELDKEALAEANSRAEHYYANWKEEARREGIQGGRRANSTLRARRMILAARQAATFQRQRADVLAAQLDKLRADMADPIQPERASDIARLVRERDEARNAAAATSARNASLQAALNDLGDKLEAMAVRVTLAERAARVAPPIAV